MKARLSIRLKRVSRPNRKPLLLFKLGVKDVHPSEIREVMNKTLDSIDDDIKRDFHIIMSPVFTSNELNIVKFE